MLFTPWCCSRLLKLVQEYVNGQLKNKYGDAFIRGNNGARCFPMTCSTIACACQGDSSPLDVCCAVLYISTVKS